MKKVSGSSWSIALALLAILGLWGCGGSAIEGASLSASCSTTETVSAGGIEEADDNECATVAVMENIGDEGGDAALLGTMKELFVTVLDNDLTRAQVISSSDVAAATTFEEWKQLLGYECDDASSCNNLATEFGSGFANADILVMPTFFVVGDNYYLFVSAQNIQKGTSIGRWEASATANTAGSALEQLASQAADSIKDQMHCLSMTPKAVAIDYDDSSKRTQIFSAHVKNLKDENADVGSVVFSLASPEWGTLSAESVAVGGGEAETTFTMTKRRTNTLTATYSSDTENDKDVTSTIIPLCGFVISINGQRTFTVDREPFTLFEPGSWWTYLGSSTVTGYVPLVDDEETPETVFGTGWYQEPQSANTAAHIISRNADDTGTIECDISGSEIGTSNGDWYLWGTRTDDTATVESLGLGISGGGRTVTGSCPGMSAGGGGLFTTLASFGSTEIQLEEGATATATGNDGVSDYTYTLRVLRAEK